MFQTSFIEISESAVKSNINFIKQFLGDDVIFSSVVKGNAYGHGISHYCPIAYNYGVRYFSVFSAQEALSVTKALPNQLYTLMIMGQIENMELEWAIEKGVEFYVFNLNRLDAAIHAAKKIGQKARIHIEFETGMNRTGILPQDVSEVLKKIKTNIEYIDVKGICTHFAGAEDFANHERVRNQFDRFKAVETELSKHSWLKPIKHLASSSATIRFPETQRDLVRLGILQFGFFPTQEIFVHYSSTKKAQTNPLKRILSWKTRIMDIKTIEAGQFIGYGTSYFTNRQTTVAYVPVGYSSGYTRSLSNQGKVLINGVRFDVIGTVNMSMLAVDITSHESVQLGDEVVLIGNQGDQEITVSSFSDFSQLINYELLTRLPEDIPRIITK